MFCPVTALDWPDRGPRDDDVRRVRPMADLGTMPAKPAAAVAGPSTVAPPIQEEPTAEADQQTDSVAPAALQDAQSGPTPPTPPTAGKRSGDVPAEDAEKAAALVAARLPSDIIPPDVRGLDGGPSIAEQAVRVALPMIPAGL